MYNLFRVNTCGPQFHEFVAILLIILLQSAVTRCRAD